MDWINDPQLFFDYWATLEGQKQNLRSLPALPTYPLTPWVFLESTGRWTFLVKTHSKWYLISTVNHTQFFNSYNKKNTATTVSVDDIRDKFTAHTNSLYGGRQWFPNDLMRPILTHSRGVNLPHGLYIRSENVNRDIYKIILVWKKFQILELSPLHKHL